MKPFIQSTFQFSGSTIHSGEGEEAAVLLGARAAATASLSDQVLRRHRLHVSKVAGISA